MALAQTLAERILVHLRMHPVDTDAADVPPEVTQEGIAARIGAQVAHVSRALKSLELRGFVAAHLAHPRGARRRSRAYSLTDTGREKAGYLEMPAGPLERVDAPKHAEPVRSPAGRDAQFAQLVAALDEAAKGGPRVALVEGDAGMGKTRLLDAFANEAQRRRARVLRAKGMPTGDEQIVGPLGPALEPLGFDRRVKARTAGSPRERALGAAVEALESAGKSDPVIVVLDDLHLAGPSVAEFLHGLVLALPKAARVLVVAAFRQEEAWELPNGPLYTALTPLRQMPGARHIVLPPLDRAGVTTLLREVGADHVPSDLIDRVVRESGGNPLYVLAMSDAMLDGIDEEDFFPQSVRALATSRFAGLDKDAHAALQAAAVCGAEFDYEDLAALHEGAEGSLLATLDVLLDKLILEEVGSDRDALRLRFSHPKVREAVLAETSATRRRWLEARRAQTSRQQRSSPA